MRTRWTLGTAGCVFSTAILAWVPPALAGNAHKASLTPPDAEAVARAREGAVRRLDGAECRSVFSDFRDLHGRTIASKLAEWALDPADFTPCGGLPGRHGPAPLPQRQGRARLLARRAPRRCVPRVREARARPAPGGREPRDPRAPAHARARREPAEPRGDHGPCRGALPMTRTSVSRLEGEA
jgi:hypothetical protein